MLILFSPLVNFGVIFKEENNYVSNFMHFINFFCAQITQICLDLKKWFDLVEFKEEKNDQQSKTDLTMILPFIQIP